MQEIGSEFWKAERRHIAPQEEIYLSGRTALDVIVQDAVKTYGITAALLPSYCCYTMIEPFLRNGVPVRFYDVYTGSDGLLTAEIPAPQKNEALYRMQYFGDTHLRCVGPGRALAGWAVTIEDLTHSCFDKGCQSDADYWFTSCRKWFAVDGIAVAGKKVGQLPPAPYGTHTAYCALRNQAFAGKQQYLSGKAADPEKKQAYLDTFAQAEKLLSEEYRGYGASPESVYDLFRFLDGIERTRQKRRENAQALLSGLKMVEGIKAIASFSDEQACPLFVPLAVGGGKRDALRRYLIGKEIYCPVHWPLSGMHAGISDRAKEIYGRELSLVCDQRYTRADMERVGEEIRNFFGKTRKDGIDETGAGDWRSQGRESRSCNDRI